ncbi:MAG: SRPBCC family protein [Candidatus Diapherotrites archaeon]|nr:SRPBCC family protein [Candidatus Diapherotrites archaeon]MDZ4256043.1 SRPBCC family protein [archaeon]
MAPKRKQLKPKAPSKKAERGKTIRQTITFSVPPEKVYEALMDSKKHSFFTQSKASISRRVGGSISAYDDYITGKNLELIPGKRIVQSWRASDWEKGEPFSIVRFELEKSRNGTKLVFTHENIPSSHAASIAEGWNAFYWKPMKVFLER